MALCFKIHVQKNYKEAIMKVKISFRIMTQQLNINATWPTWRTRTHRQTGRKDRHACAIERKHYLPFLKLLSTLATKCLVLSLGHGDNRHCVDELQCKITWSQTTTRSASSTSLNVRRTRLSTVGDRAFPVAAARLWNSLPSHVTPAPSLHLLLSS